MSLPIASLSTSPGAALSWGPQSHCLWCQKHSSYMTVSCLHDCILFIPVQIIPGFLMPSSTTSHSTTRFLHCIATVSQSTYKSVNTTYRKLNSSDMYSVPTDGSLTQRKFRTLKDASQPQFTSEACLFLRLAKYSPRFMRNFAILTEPPHKLTTQGSEWPWGSSESEAFYNAKKALSEDTITQHFVKSHRNCS